MRPTYLKFRSPKEETPGFLIPLVTHKGKSLDYKPRHEGGSFTRGGRFQYISDVARRTGFNVGPGSYNYKVSTNSGIGTKIVKEGVIANFNRLEWDYSYVGDSIVRVPKPKSRNITPNTSLFLASSYYSNDKSTKEMNSGLKDRKEFPSQKITFVRPPAKGSSDFDQKAKSFSVMDNSNRKTNRSFVLPSNTNRKINNRNNSIDTTNILGELSTTEANITAKQQPSQQENGKKEENSKPNKVE